MDTLPIELIVDIFKYLSPYEVLKTARVLCRRFSKASDVLYPNGSLYGFPIRIWQRICHFSEYLPILRLSETSVSFHQLVKTSESPEIRRLMFHEALPRVPVPVRVTKTDDPTETTHLRTPASIDWRLHPYFDDLKYSFKEDNFFFRMKRGNVLRYRAVKPSPDENATSPPARSVMLTFTGQPEYLQSHPLRPVRVSVAEGSERGLSITDVLAALRKMFLLPMDPRQVLKARIALGKAVGTPDPGIEPWAAWLKRCSGVSEQEFEKELEAIEYDGEPFGLEDVWTTPVYPPQRDLLSSWPAGWLALSINGGIFSNDELLVSSNQNWTITQYEVLVHPLQ